MTRRINSAGAGNQGSRKLHSGGSLQCSWEHANTALCFVAMQPVSCALSLYTEITKNLKQLALCLAIF